MQKHVNLVDLVKSFPTKIYLQNLASIQKRTSPVKFAHLPEKSGIAVRYRTFHNQGADLAEAVAALADGPALAAAARAARTLAAATRALLRTRLNKIE